MKTQYRNLMTLITLLVIGMAGVASGQCPILPFPDCEVCDLNGNEIWDWGDVILFAPHIGWIGNSIADFNSNGCVDLDDVEFLSSCMPADPGTCPPPTGIDHDGTIGVYFDAAATVTQIVDVAPFTIIDVYVSTLGFTEPVGGYMFRINMDPRLVVISETYPSGRLDMSSMASPHTYLISAEPTCLLPTVGPAELMHLTVMLIEAGAADVPIWVTGSNTCHAPSEFPSSTTCGTSAWKYFDPAYTGKAVINPTDFNNNTIPDINEAVTTRYYRITGNSTGIGWSMGIRGTGDVGYDHERAVNGPLAVGEPASEFVSAFVSGLNELSPSVTANPILNGAGFSVSVPGTDGFELGVGPSGSVVDCWMPTSPSCSFNPDIQEIADPLTSTPPGDPVRSLSNYPNPFNPGTVIAFDLPARAEVSLHVYDMSGRLIRTLLDGEVVEPGRRDVAWNGTDDGGRSVAAGVYVYRLDAGEYSEVRCMALIK